MKTTAFALCTVLMLSLSACNNQSDAQTTVASAYDDLMKGNSTDFVQLLTDDALEKFGNATAQASLRKYLNDASGVSVGEEQLVNRENVGLGEMELFYNVPVVSQGKTLLELGVSCNLQESPACSNDPLSHPGPIGTCPYTTVLCKISSIVM